MIPRLAFFLVAAFWVAMNALLWRAEYGSRGSGLAVPADLVWRKILTAPDTSSLTVYQNGKKSGFCQFATSVEQAMSALEEDTLPPEGILQQAGYQIRFDGKPITNTAPDKVFRLGIARTFQLTRIFPRLTVLENMHVAAQRHGLRALIERWSSSRKGVCQ